MAVKRISDAKLDTRDMMHNNNYTLIKRKSAYAKSRLPTFGSLTTAKPMHQGSKMEIGARKSHFNEAGGITQKSDHGGTRQKMSPKRERHQHHHNMTSHQ